ncbi:GNAT family N-acetyltransferase [Butyricicoccus faecihominis]|uniref:GNAT family N-acetyltransferase n=1 Tax=Butyricicoccaceae TaxID=3085642 RepID=UPI002479256A|nr:MULTISPECIES: GNAT family N-acetyltransferase [Butyricicoccaceae]MCQ5129374.1 GNAT family N-acetyltransferase [Butyricicoccus faecihominis]WNX85138.1 GNAT family N-acetyltransferase [Agathobaculum sp. NTUH-O15-33]
MLLPLTVSEIPAFTAACGHEHVFGSKALTALRAYGLGDPRARFYVCIKGREPAAALYQAGSVLVISSDERADSEVIADLVRREQITEVDTNWTQCQDLQRLLGGTTESSYYMVYRGPLSHAEFPDIVPGDKAKVFDVLGRSHEYYRTHFEYDSWAGDIAQKQGRGLLELYQLERDGKAVGTGCIVSEDDECGVLAAIAVVPEYRHQGLGSYISRFLTQRILQKGKTPRLIAGYDEVAELYRRIGFAPCGRWGELYL